MDWLRDEQYRRAGVSPTKKGPPFHEIVSEAIALMRSSDSSVSINKGAQLMEQASPNVAAHRLIDELIEARPETAKNMLATIRALLKEERVEATTVPAAANPQLKSKKVSAG